MKKKEKKKRERERETLRKQQGDLVDKQTGN
jgi:hypothetical protein